MAQGEGAKLLRHWFNLPVPEQSRYDAISSLIAYSMIRNSKAHCNECLTSVDCCLKGY